MRNRGRHLRRTIECVLVAVCVAGIAFAEGDISDVNKYAWSENCGWQNWNPTYGGVSITRDGDNGYLSGWVWGENIGWIKLGDGTGPYDNLSASTYGVNLDELGALSGYGWSENCGWISFSNAHSQVVIVGRSFDGYAWSENVGYIHFKNTSETNRYSVDIKTSFSGTMLKTY